MSGPGLTRLGVLNWGFGSSTHGLSSCAPTKRLPYVGEALGRGEQYPPSGSPQMGNPSLTGVSHPSSLGG